jgi:purine-nucleoside phosphorylase
MATPHISAPDGAFAKTVLMPGDPLRAKFIAEHFLTDAQQVNEVRNCLGFTGKYNGKPVSVMASGIGMPSIGVYSYELYKYYGVENIVRIGSAGSYTADLNVMDVVLTETSYSDSSYALIQNGCKEHIMLPSAELNAVILKKAQELGIECKLAKVHSSDVFYSDPSMGGWKSIRERTGTECVEMESFALFHNANVCGKRAATLLTISDSFVSQVELSAEDRQNSFVTMMRLALESAVAF